MNNYVLPGEICIANIYDNIDFYYIVLSGIREYIFVSIIDKKYISECYDVTYIREKYVYKLSTEIIVDETKYKIRIV